jgi:hypothetical protein
MAQVTGIVKIYVNGKLQRSKEGASLDMGGKERTMQTGHSVYGYSEKIIPSSLTFDLVHTSDTDLVELGGIVDGRARFECDTGVTYLITNACTTKTPKLKDGVVSMEMQGDPAEPE